ncbi:MAG: diacylglycerol kinase family protein [Dethiobacteria bacterium]|jgi:diacylglycerol kinase (ATP)
MRRLSHSFRDAIAGLRYCMVTQRNMVIHLFVGGAVVLVSVLLHLKPWELLFIITAVFAVLIAETINTALEKTVDLITREQHVLAHIAKDVAAGAVLLSAIYAILVGLLIFGPRLWKALLRLIHI